MMTTAPPQRAPPMPLPASGQLPSTAQPQACAQMVLIGTGAIRRTKMARQNSMMNQQGSLRDAVAMPAVCG